MGEYRASGLTDGFLPEAAFLHLSPTAIGDVELDRELAALQPAPDSSLPGSPDALLTVHLQDEPMAMIHVGSPLEDSSPRPLAETVWRQAAAEIRAHCERYGCCAPLRMPRRSSSDRPPAARGCATPRRP